MSGVIEVLRGTDDISPVMQGRKIEETKSIVLDICHSLTVPSNMYKPEGTKKKIVDLLNQPGFNRILYSEISKFVFTQEDEATANLLQNVESLVDHAVDDNYVPENEKKDYRKVAFKLYDHCNLAAVQSNNAKLVFDKSISGTKEELNKSFKGLEREYITILGIFASIILAFVGGITFSTSVLNNINSVSSYKLFAVIDMLAVLLLGTLHMLMRFICKLNGASLELRWEIYAGVVVALSVITTLGLIYKI